MRPTPPRHFAGPVLALLAATALAFFATPAGAASREELQDTRLISQGRDGLPANASTRNPVISQDRRYATVIAFESDATNMVAGDTNHATDVFFIKRNGAGSSNKAIDNLGSDWALAPPQLASRGLGGQPANGRSWAPAIDGGFAKPSRRGPTYASCVAFLSNASNLVARDTNRVTDAFVVLGSRSRGPSGRPRAVSNVTRAHRRVTDVAVSTDCSHIAYVAGGKLYVRTTVGTGRRARAVTRRVRAGGVAANPSFASGQSDDLVFDTPAGVWFEKDARGRPRLLAPGGRNPAYQDVKCRVLAYEKTVDGVRQIAYRYLGVNPDAPGNRNCYLLPAKPGQEVIASSRSGVPGNGPSRNPSVVNSGFYIAFESDATNLGTESLGLQLDDNRATDAYVYTGVRDITLLMSQDPGQRIGTPFPTGGRQPRPSWYLNYVLFTSRGPGVSADQVWMRYLGPA